MTNKTFRELLEKRVKSLLANGQSVESIARTIGISEEQTAMIIEKIVEEAYNEKEGDE